jgi:predicted NBD/HSP70 family sugar kinase
MYLGIDIGGTKTLLARFTKDGDLQETLKFPTPKDYEEFKTQLANNVARITTKPWKLACVGAPGIIDHENGIDTFIPQLKWSDIPFVADVKKFTDCDSVLIENDAKLAGLSEARFLDKPYHKVLYLTVSTGIGGAQIIDGKLDPEMENSEPGHMKLEHHGKLIEWEKFASGKAIKARFNKLASEINDPHVWKLISYDIATGLIDLIAVLQPNIIIIGGGVGTHFKKFEKPLKEALKEYETPLVQIPKIIGAKNAEQAVIYGCYQLLKDHAKEQVHAKSIK